MSERDDESGEPARPDESPASPAGSGGDADGADRSTAPGGETAAGEPAAGSDLAAPTEQEQTAAPEGDATERAAAETPDQSDPPESDPPAGWRGLLRPGRPTPTRAVTVVLLVLLGFAFTVQVRSVAEDPTVAALGQEDLVRILANLDAHEERLRQDLVELQETHRRLTTAGESQQEALAEARRRADELGVLAGTLPVIGPGLVVELHGAPEAVDAARLLDAVQELRSAGAEAIQVAGGDGTPVRIIASSYFLDAEGGIEVDGRVLREPYTLTVVGEPQTLAPALRIPGGVVESVQRDGGTVTLHEEPGGVEVSAVREQDTLQHARPDS